MFQPRGPKADFLPNDSYREAIPRIPKNGTSCAPTGNKKHMTVNQLGASRKTKVDMVGLQVSELGNDNSNNISKDAETAKLKESISCDHEEKLTSVIASPKSQLSTGERMPLQKQNQESSFIVP